MNEWMIDWLIDWLIDSGDGDDDDDDDDGGGGDNVSERTEMREWEARLDRGYFSHGTSVALVSVAVLSTSTVLTNVSVRQQFYTSYAAT